MSKSVTCIFSLMSLFHVSSYGGNIFTLGIDDESQAEFSQESFNSNSAPGSPNLKDDDYYFSGSYDGIGVLQADEDIVNFERAVTNGDKNNRIHFHLDSNDIINAEYTLTVDLIGGGWWDATAGASGAGWGTHDVSANFNGVEVFAETEIIENRLVTAVFDASSVNAVAGENVIEITRTGGDSKGDGTDYGWIQFDYITLESGAFAEPGLIQSFSADSDEVAADSPTATLSWQIDSDPEITVFIDNGIGEVTAITSEGVGSIDVRISAVTTYVITVKGVDGDEESASVTIGYEPYAEIWTVGLIDGSQAEFSQEKGTSNEESDGSPLFQDDDYFIAGNYGGTIGNLESDEDWSNMDRAVTNNDPNNRFHFLLDSLQADERSQMRFTMNLISGGWWDADANSSGEGFGTHDVEIKLNGNVISSHPDITENELIVETFSGKKGGAVQGENVIEVSRTGGDSKGDGGNSGWIQIDFASLEVDLTEIVRDKPIVSFSSNKSLIAPGVSASLNWLVDPTAKVSIDQGIGDVSSKTIFGIGSIEVDPTVNTTYTLTSVRGADVETATVTVQVDLIEFFKPTVLEVTPDEPVARLSWSVYSVPGMTLSVDNGIGDVTGLTEDGSGSIEVRPSSTTTYTMTATRPNTPQEDTEQVSFTVEYNGYSVLWSLGVDDNTQAEFSQENFNSNALPGAADVKDDDYYFAGTYADIGEVLEDEDSSLNFERAVTNGDPNNRIHFMLSPEQASPSSEIRISMDLINGGGWDAPAGQGGAGFGIHDVAVKFNGEEVMSSEGIEKDTFLSATFNAAEVGAEIGENTIEITRTGGDSKGDGTDYGWIQFDYILAEIDSIGPRIFEINEYEYDADGKFLSITFPSSPGQSFLVEVSNDMQTWFEYDDSVEAAEEGSSTTYEVEFLGDEGDAFFVRASRFP